jgi:hypothetical protein
MISDWLVLIILLLATRFVSRWVIVLALVYFASLFNRVVIDRQLDRSVYKKTA